LIASRRGKALGKLLVQLPTGAGQGVTELQDEIAGRRGRSGGQIRLGRARVSPWPGLRFAAALVPHQRLEGAHHGPRGGGVQPRQPHRPSHSCVARHDRGLF
jgi:hypothetical protein